MPILALCLQACFILFLFSWDSVEPVWFPGGRSTSSRSVCLFLGWESSIHTSLLSRCSNKCSLAHTPKWTVTAPRSFIYIKRPPSLLSSAISLPHHQLIALFATKLPSLFFLCVPKTRPYLLFPSSSLKTSALRPHMSYIPGLPSRTTAPRSNPLLIQTPFLPCRRSQPKPSGLPTLSKPSLQRSAGILQGLSPS